MALGLAVIGLLLIGFGSFLGIAAPGDGQTGMFAFPLWFMGAICGVAAIVIALARRTSALERLGVLVCAVLAIASVVWVFVASDQWVRSHPPSSGLEGSGNDSSKRGD